MALGDDSHGTRLASGLSGGKIKRLHSCQKVNDTPTGRADSEIPRSLEPRIKAVKTRLSPVSERFVIGAPMLFRLELVNEGVDPIHYMDTGARYKPLLVQNEKKEPINYQPEHMQIRVQKEELAARSSVIVAERIGINAGKEIIRPGKYSVQFNSTEIALGQPTTSEEMGRYGETLPTSVFDFIVATNESPSNVIEIEVKPWASSRLTWMRFSLSIWRGRRFELRRCRVRRWL